MTLRDIARWPHSAYWRMTMVTGGGWGATMFALERLGVMGSPTNLVLALVVWTIAGLLFGLSMTAWVWLVRGRFAFQKTPGKGDGQD